MKNEQLKNFIISQKGTVVEAMKKIDSNAKGILFTTDENDKLVGVITDGDIRRWLIKTGDLQVCVNKIMNKAPKTIFNKDVNNVKRCMTKHSITALPVINEENRITDIIFKEEQLVDDCKKNESSILNGVPVVIMAGGKGTRLYPYTKILPKPLIPIGDIPIIERIIDSFYYYEVSDFYVTVNYKKNMIKSYFTECASGYHLNYIEENEPLGTGGSLHLIGNRISIPFFVTNCDILIHANYEDIYRYHLETKNELTIVAALKNIVVPYGVIHSSKNGMIESMDEKPELSYFINTGMYVLNSELIQEIPKDTFFHMTDLVDKLLNEKRQVGMYPVSEDSFLDMGELEEMHRMEKKLNINN